MTTGFTYTPGGYPGYNFLLYRNWSGADGKYQVDGNDKWNSYNTYFLQESDQIGNSTHAMSTTSGAIKTWTGADEMRLQSKLVKLIKGHEFNLAVDLAQAHQLVDMVSSTILHFGRSLRYLKRGDIPGACRELGIDGRHKKLKSKDVSGRWLELQYGWLPTMGSVFEAAKAFEALSSGRANRVVAVVKREYPYDGSAEPSNYTSGGKTTIIKKIVFEMEEELSFGRSLGLTDPLQVIWEIIPFSFVADWFLPIGTYLENLAIIPKLKGRFLVTTYSRTESRITAIKTASPLYQGARRVGLQIEMKREVLPNLTTQLPTFVDPITAMTSKRIANAVSLFHQLVL